MHEFFRSTFIKLAVVFIVVLSFGLYSQNASAQKAVSTAKIKKLETDVAVIGAGPGGLSAALRAAELGLKVCLFEKTDHTGGILNGGMGPFGAGTHIQEKYGIKNCTPRDAFEYLMDFTHWQIDARLASEYINSTAFMVKWLEDQGVIFSAMDTGRGGYMHAISPHPDYETDAKGMYICMLLTDRVKEKKNIDLFLETPVKKLVKTGNAVTGLIAEDKTGNHIEVSAKAVIIMTGGFYGNPDMIEENTSFTYGKNLFYTYERPNISGDGIRMAWEVGAAKSEMMMDVYKGMPILGGPAGTKNEWSVIADPNLMVNLKGDRFVDETVDRVYMGNAIHRQPEGCAFLLFDSTIAGIWRAKGPGVGPDNSVTIADVDKIVAEAKALNYPYLYAADSLEELCAQTGIELERLKETIAEYNSFCDDGNDPVFYKDTRFLLPLLGPKYYAAKFCCDSWGGLGGIKIDYKTEVLGENLDPIPGLYAGGSDANSIYAGTYPSHLSGNTTGFAYTTGLMAAKNAVEYIKANQEKKVVISVEELGKKLGVPGEEIVIPNGETRYHQEWSIKNVEQAISELQFCFDSPETTYLLTEISEPWITLALMEALKPLHVKYLYPRSDGTELEMVELKRGEQSPNYDVVFEVFEKGDKVFINLTSDTPDALTIGHHTFNLDNLSKVVIPEIPAGKNVFIHGKGMYSVMVCIAKNYTKDAKSLSIASHDTDYICAVSYSNKLEVGDVTPRTLENNL